MAYHQTFLLQNTKSYWLLAINQEDIPRTDMVSQPTSIDCFAP